MAVCADVSMDRCAADDITGVAGDTGCGAGNTTMIFTLVTNLEICGVSAVAAATVGRLANDMS